MLRRSLGGLIFLGLFVVVLTACGTQSQGSETVEFESDEAMSRGEAAKVLASRYQFDTEEHEDGSSDRQKASLETLIDEGFPFLNKDVSTGFTYGEFAEVIDYLFDLTELLSDEVGIKTESSDSFSENVPSIIHLLDSLDVIELEEKEINLKYPVHQQEFSLALERLTRHELVDRKVDHRSGIAVLMYHRFYDQGVGEEYHDMHSNLNIANFREQLELLDEYGYETLTLLEFKQYLEGSKEISDNSVVITFDDGSKTIHEYAYPVMKDYDVNGISYMISGRIKEESTSYHGDPMQTMSWDEMYDMYPRIEIGGHTYSFHDRDHEDEPSYLITKPKQEVTDDLTKDFQLLDEPSSFAYPYGDYNEETIEILNELGYELAFTTELGRVLPGDPRFELKRYDISDNVTIDQFAEYIGLDKNEK
ncbi:hypothetical protein DH09_10170 [Bacillaceae bacterium JMAK1]|nr:hypothetical protein DH09_10170 [Bacillaceae bacterium JMAK1]